MRGALVLVIIGSFFSDAAVIDSSTTIPHLELIFNTKYDKIFSLKLDKPTSLKQLTSTNVPIESCHENITESGIANIIDFNINPNNSVVWMSWNERIYINDNLLMWYKYYDYQQFSQRRIAVDYQSKLIYSIDKFISPWVEVIDFDGKNKKILFSFDVGERTKDFLFEGTMPESLRTATFEGMLYKVEFPVDLVVDVEEGLIFVMTRIDGVARIHKAKVDGTQRSLLVSNSGKIVNDDCGRLSLQSGRIYWTNCDENVIESVDYNGENRIVVLKDENLLAMTVWNDWVIWSTNSTGSVIKMCRMIDNSCDSETIVKIPVPQLNKPVYKIQTRQSSAQRDKSLKNNCSQLELNGKCVCRNGYIQNNEECLPVTKYLVYESNNYITSKSVEPYIPENDDDETFNFQPDFVWGLIEKNQVASMDYDEKSGRLFYAECRNLLQLKLEEDMRGCWLVDRNDTDCLKFVAYDAKRMNLFLVRHDGSNGKYYLEMVKLGTNKFQRFAYLIPTRLRQVIQPLALLVHGDFLFLLDISSQLIIFNINGNYLSGASVTNLKARGLTMDDENRRLYWYDDEGRIGYVSFEEEKVEVLDGKSPIEGVNAIVVDETWIYLKNYKSIWRVDKNSGGDAMIVVKEKKNTKLSSSMKIIKRSVGRLSNQATEAACEVFCEYNWHRLAEETYKRDEEFCKCLR